MFSTKSGLTINLRKENGMMLGRTRRPYFPLSPRVGVQRDVRLCLDGLVGHALVVGVHAPLDPSGLGNRHQSIPETAQLPAEGHLEHGLLGSAERRTTIKMVDVKDGLPPTYPVIPSGSLR